jgi:hypothetical protein
MRYSIYILFFFFPCFNVSKGQAIDKGQINFEKAYSEINDMLNNKQKPSFKRAVFVVENAYLDDSLDYKIYLSVIELYKRIALSYKKANSLKDYNYSDSTQVALNGALFKVFTDTIYDSEKKIVSVPFTYDFEDVFGNNDFTKTFITKLLLSKSGTCHSLPYLYKIIAEELSTQAYLSFAPHHIYIKQRNKKIGWYNTELTSGQFPIDGYLMATGYISRVNILSGIYMDTLSYQQSIATCLMDLSYAYRAKKDSLADNEFVLKCADLALSVYPNYVQALLVKAETHKAIYLKSEKEKNTLIAQNNFQLMKDTYNKLIKLGYSEVPIEIFNKWFASYQKNKEQYQNSEINTIFNTSNSKK